MERKLTAILYAEVVGYSRLTGADEEGTYETLKVHLGALIGAIEGHGGRIVNTAGDAVLAEFASVVDAMRCAVALQAALVERAAADEYAKRLVWRMGLNVGDVIAEDGKPEVHLRCRGQGRSPAAEVRLRWGAAH